MREEDIAAAPRGNGRTWPNMTLPQAEEKLCAPGALFEMEAVHVNGAATLSWKNQPANLAALANLARDQFSSNTFLVFEDERVSYGAWFRATATLAQALRERGVAKGDRVALATRNLPEWPVAFFAATSIGAIVVPLNSWWTGAELQFGLKNSAASVLICDEERWQRIASSVGSLPKLRRVLVARGAASHSRNERLESIIGSPKDYAILPDYDLPQAVIAPGDNATIFYTSGTTGSPKGVLGSHRNILASTLSGAYAVHRAAMRRGEEPPAPEPKVSLCAIPFFHVTACNSILIATTMAGGAIVMMRKWDPLEAMALIERERVTQTGGVPTIVWQLLEHPERHRFDLSSLEAISYGGAPAAPELVRRINTDLNVEAATGWGMTETSAAVTYVFAEDYSHRPDSCGPAVPISRLKIMNEEGTRELPVGKVGELWATGPQIAKGYWRNPAATAATFQNGWVKTGDLARLDGDGFCFIVDRAKDIIIRGGENIYSIEIESALYDHPAVIDAAVIPIPHRILGEVPAAVVYLTPGIAASEAELQAWVRERLAHFKVPVRIHFIEETLPRNANGKIRKKELKALFAPSVATR